MRMGFRRITAGLAAGATLLAVSTTAMAADLVVNGSFETGLAGWTVAPGAVNAGGATCSFNGATAPGAETISLEPGYPATAGTEIALGSIANVLVGPLGVCVLYQDVAIPLGATTANFIVDHAAKAANGLTVGDAAYTIGLYPTTSVPDWFDVADLDILLSAGVTADATLTNTTVSNVDISALAGTTVRLAIVLAADNNVGQAVIGLDNIQIDATVAPPPVPTLTEWAMILFGLLLAGGAALHLSRRRMTA